MRGVNAVDAPTVLSTSPAKVKRWRLVEAQKVGRDVWDTNTITYEVTGSKHFKGIRIGFGAEPGDKAAKSRAW